jgi:hypothetical protein
MLILLIRMKIWVRNRLYPVYACEDCIGMNNYYNPHGCQCAAYEAPAPGVGPSKKLIFLRFIAKKIWPDL